MEKVPLARSLLHKILDALEADLDEDLREGLTVDVDPVSML